MMMYVFIWYTFHIGDVDNFPIKLVKLYIGYFSLSYILIKEYFKCIIPIFPEFLEVI
jgi:hypothetical protein